MEGRAECEKSWWGTAPRGAQGRLAGGEEAASTWFSAACALCSEAQSCPTLCDLKDCSLPGSSVRGDSPGRNTEGNES